MKDFQEITDPINWELGELLGYCKELHIPIYAINHIDLYDRSNLVRIVKEDIAKNIKQINL